MNALTPNKLKKMSAYADVIVSLRGDHEVVVRALDGGDRFSAEKYAVSDMDRLVVWCLNNHTSVDCPIQTLIECLHAAGELFTVASNGAAVAVEHNCFTHVGLPVDTEAALAICARLGIEVAAV